MSRSADDAPVVRTWFVVHFHQTGRPHYDLRIRTGADYRNWSILKAPLLEPGKSRLAVERERLSLQTIEGRTVAEETFGAGPVDRWDEGEVDARVLSPRLYQLDFRGGRMRGRYEMRQTRWYPGNRWLLRRLPQSGESG